MPLTFTTDFGGLVNEIATAAQVESLQTGESINARAVWDTGAQMTVITSDLARKISLAPDGVATIRGVTGEERVNTYTVNLVLPSGYAVQTMVLECRASDSFDLLIGMDIISLGDFAISNKDGQAVFSFRVPSMERIDFS
jgi:hypothetical protein